MSESTDPVATTTQVEVPLETGGVHAPEKVAQSTQIVTVHHNPGSPLATQEDLDASEAYNASLVPAVVLVPVEYGEGGIDTRTAEGNYATRSNIVRP